MEEVKLPELGENIETVEVSAVLVAVGDRISAQQPVVEVETEKASLEVPSTVTGKVEEILVAVGGQVRVGEPLLRVSAAGGGEAKPVKKAKVVKPVEVAPAPAPEAVAPAETPVVISFPIAPPHPRPGPWPGNSARRSPGCRAAAPAGESRGRTSRPT